MWTDSEFPQNLPGFSGLFSFRGWRARGAFLLYLCPMKASLGQDQVEKHPLGPSDKGVPPRLWAVQEEPDDSTRRVPTVTGHCQHPWGTFADRQPPVMGAYLGLSETEDQVV